MSAKWFPLACLWVPMLLRGDPLIFPRGVVNSASYLPAALPGGAIAQGAIFTIFGSGLGPATPVGASAFPLSTTLGGVSVKVTQGSSSVAAYPVFAAAGQLNVVMPSNAPLGRVSVQVTYGGTASNPAPVTVVASGFGSYSANSSGKGPGIVQNYVTATDQPTNSLNQPAKPGQTEILWGTGLGSVAGGDNIAPPAGTLPTPVEVFVGGVAAPVGYSGRSPCCAGLDEIVFTVPRDAPLGCYVPVMVRTGGATPGNSVSIAITGDGSSCVGSLPPVAQTFARGGKAGVVNMMSWTLHSDIEAAPVDVGLDFANASFYKASANPYFFQPLLSPPPAGACSTYASPSDLTDFLQISPLIAIPGTGLDAGVPGGISGAGGSLPLSYWLGGKSLGNLLGFNVAGIQSSPYFTSGAYKLTVNGGAEVGAASVTLPYTAPVNWTNRDAASVVTVNRSTPLTVNWTGADASAQVFILGGNVDIPTNSTGAFLCAAPPAAASFTIPAPVLQTVPPARLRSGQQIGAIFIAVTPSAAGAPFSAQGIDVGGAFFLSLTGRTVMFR